MEKNMAGENTKSDVKVNFFKKAREGEREREFIERTLYNQTNISMKKNHLHGKQLDKQKAAKRNL